MEKLFVIKYKDEAGYTRQIHQPMTKKEAETIVEFRRKYSFVTPDCWIEPVKED